jgi:chromosomal replication initiation ATPase DnaA
MTDQDKADIIIAEVCRYYNTSYDEINVKCRKREMVEPRQVIMYFMTKFTGFCQRQIGNYFGKDHATTLYAVREIGNLIQVNGFAEKTNIMAGRINFNIRQFDVRKDAESFERWSNSIPQY